MPNLKLEKHVDKVQNLPSGDTMLERANLFLNYSLTRTYKDIYIFVDFTKYPFIISCIAVDTHPRRYGIFSF